MEIRKALISDLEEILVVQKLAFQSEAVLYNNSNIDPMVECIENLKKEFPDSNKKIFVAIKGSRIIGSIRTKTKGQICQIQKLSVHPYFQHKGVGKSLVKHAECSQINCKKFELFTGEKSEQNIRFYNKLGYAITNTELYPDGVHMVYMEKYCKNKVLIK